MTDRIDELERWDRIRPTQSGSWLTRVSRTYLPAG